MSPAWAREQLESERARLQTIGDAMWDDVMAQMADGRTPEELEGLLTVRGGVIDALNALWVALRAPWLAEDGEVAG